MLRTTIKLVITLSRFLLRSLEDLIWHNTDVSVSFIKLVTCIQLFQLFCLVLSFFMSYAQRYSRLLSLSLKLDSNTCQYSNYAE
jgi:hypothetical protein